MSSEYPPYSNYQTPFSQGYWPGSYLSYQSNVLEPTYGTVNTAPTELLDITKPPQTVYSDLTSPQAPPTDVTSNTVDPLNTQWNGYPYHMPHIPPPVDNTATTSCTLYSERLDQTGSFPPNQQNFYPHAQLPPLLPASTPQMQPAPFSCVSPQFNYGNEQREEGTSPSTLPIRTGKRGGKANKEDTDEGTGDERDTDRRSSNNARERIRVRDINTAFKDLGKIHAQFLPVITERDQTKLGILHQTVNIITTLEEQVKKLYPNANCLKKRYDEKLPISPDCEQKPLGSQASFQ